MRNVDPACSIQNEIRFPQCFLGYSSSLIEVNQDGRLRAQLLGHAN